MVKISPKKISQEEYFARSNCALACEHQYGIKYSNQKTSGLSESVYNNYQIAHDAASSAAQCTLYCINQL